MKKSINLAYNREDLESVCYRLLSNGFPRSFHAKSIGLGIALFLFGLFLLFINDTQIIKFLIFTTFLVFAIWYFVRDWLSYKKGQRNVAHFIEMHEDIQMFKLIYDEAGMTQISSTIKIEVAWKNAKLISTDIDYIYVREDDEKIIIIPSEFMDREYFEELKEFMDDIDHRLMEGTLDN